MATTLISEQSAREVVKIQAAAFEAGVVNQLTSAQLSALKASFEADEIVRILQSLIGGGPSGGPGMHGNPGPGGSGGDSSTSTTSTTATSGNMVVTKKKLA